MSDDDAPRIHTTPEEGHPAGDGPRSDREIGGPVAAEDAPEGQAEGRGAPGTVDNAFEPHD